MNRVYRADIIFINKYGKKKNVNDIKFLKGSKGSKLLKWYKYCQQTKRIPQNAIRYERYKNMWVLKVDQKCYQRGFETSLWL